MMRNGRHDEKCASIAHTSATIVLCRHNMHQMPIHVPELELTRHWSPVTVPVDTRGAPEDPQSGAIPLTFLQFYISSNNIFLLQIT